MDGFKGLAGWQWLFLLEGIPSVIVGALLITLGTAWAFCAYLFEQTGGATAPVEPTAWGHDETYAER